MRKRTCLLRTNTRAWKRRAKGRREALSWQCRCLRPGWRWSREPGVNLRPWTSRQRAVLPERSRNLWTTLIAAPEAPAVPGPLLSRPPRCRAPRRLLRPLADRGGRSPSSPPSWLGAYPRRVPCPGLRGWAPCRQLHGGAGGIAVLCRPQVRGRGPNPAQHLHLRRDTGPADRLTCPEGETIWTQWNLVVSREVPQKTDVSINQKLV